MNKLFAKIATLAAGATMAVGVAVAASSSVGEAGAAYEETATIAVGDSIVIANSANKKELTGVTKDLGTASDYSGSVPNASYPLTVESGSAAGSFAFKTNDNKYLAWTTGGGNNLYLVDAVNGSSSWTLENVSGKGTMLKNVGTDARRLSYNSSSPRFCAYGNTNQLGLNFFKYVEDGGQKFTISYNANGGSGTMDNTVASQPVVASCGFTAPAGKKFGSWNTAANGSGISYGVGTAVSSDLTLYAIWVDIPNYTCAQAISAYDNGGDITGVYVSGYVTSIYTTEEKFSDGKISYYIADTKDGGKQFEFYLGVGLNGQPFSALTDVQVGAFVKGFGIITKYNSTYEFTNGNYLVSYTPPASAALTSISLSGTQQTVFGVGDAFSSDGLIVTAHYDDESTKVVEPTSISSPDMSTAGQKTITVTYTENNVIKTATYTITVNAVVVKYTVTFSAGAGSGTMSPVEVTQGATYQLPECTFTAPEEKVFDGWTINGVDKVTQIENIAANTTVTALWKDSTPAGIVSDVLTRETTGVSGTAYDSWSDVKATSDAVYAGNSAGGKESIQLRSGTTGGSNIHSGIVSTTSGGKISSVEVVWNETDTTAGRTLWVYGSNTAYATPDELYATATSGTKVGEIVCGTSTSVEFTDEYAYVAVRCKENALYLTSITFNWEAGTPVPPPPASNYTVTYVEGSHTGAAETVAAGTQITLKNFDSQYVPLGKQFVCWSIGGVSYQVGDTYTVNANTTINAVYQDVTPEGEIQYIEVYQAPVKETYKQGQEFDPTGLIIVGVYEGDVRAQIANEVCEFSSIANAPLGKATVIVTYKGRTTSVPVVIVEPTFKSISVNKLPDKVEYERNEELDITGIEIQFNYEDNVPSKVVNPTIVDYIYDFSEPGEKTVVVKYGDSTATFKVTVLVPTMTDLVISHDATKVEYEVHDELDLTGLVVTALYSDQSAEIVSLANCVITGFDSTAPGERTVVIAYGECSVTYDVTIKVPVLVSITIGSPVTKTVYDLHQTFDPSGLSLVANYSHGEHVNINLHDVEFSGFDSESVGVKVITASYGGASTSFAITVREPVFSHIAVSELPVQVEYECFEEFNPEGMEVVNVFSDGSTTPINLEDVEFEYDFTEPGIKDVIVSYQGNTASFQVEVLEPVLVALYFYTAPDKLYYEVGEQLDLSGCYLLAELSDGELFLIPADYCEPSGFDSVTPGIKTVTLSLMGVSISYQILVKVTTYELVVAKEPTKTVYDLGDSFDPTGMKVEIHYSTGDVISVKLDKLTFSELDSSSTGEKEILISYQDMEAILVVSVREPVLVSVHADGQMGKVAYISGDEWSDEGFSLVATYSDGSTKDVSSDAIWSFSEEAPVTGMTSVIVSGEYTDGEITVSDEFELSIKVKDSLYAEAWAEEFLSLVSEACSGNEDGALNKKVELKSIWDTMSQKYVNQLSDTEKAKIIGAVANADAQDDPIARAMAFYDFACKKYGLSKFVENRVISAIVFETTSSDKVTPIALIVVASLAAVTALGMVVTYKRRKNENIH